jgi:hypothetical protein
VGILEPTGTALDNMHIVNDKTYEAIVGEDTITTKMAPEGTPKFFYAVQGNSLPEKIKSNFPENAFVSVVLAGNEYEPLYIGSTEAKMMKEEKLFNEVGDRIENFFGRKVIVAGILPETQTFFDQLHYIRN